MSETRRKLHVRGVKSRCNDWIPGNLAWLGRVESERDFLVFVTCTRQSAMSQLHSLPSFSPSWSSLSITSEDAMTLTGADTPSTVTVRFHLKKASGFALTPNEILVAALPAARTRDA